jgi:hypothetical protein
MNEGREMGHGEFKLVKQIGPRGFFGGVALNVEPCDNDGEVSIEFDEQCPREWRAGATFGVEYVLENIARHKLFPSGVRVHVNVIKGHAVDTTNVVIAYVSAMALISAIGIEPYKRPDFNQETGSFIFPK